MTQLEEQGTCNAYLKKQSYYRLNEFIVVLIGNLMYEVIK